MGLARSGTAAALFLARRGEAVVVTDRKGRSELQEEAVTLEAAGVELELSEDQAFFQQTTRKFLAAECPIATVRALEADPAG